MSNFKSHFVFTRSQQNGIFLLIVIIVILQLLYWFADFYSDSTEVPLTDKEIAKFQSQIDSIKLEQATKKTPQIYPFNPNFITDYKGYVLGMSPSEIDKLHEYRASGKWINSKADFQMVTGVSDSLLSVLSPLFKFPDFISNNKERLIRNTNQTKSDIGSKLDLNRAEAEELKKINGIGEVLSDRIINYRNSIGGFVNIIQLKDVYGLTAEVRLKLEERFIVNKNSTVALLSVNKASVLELSEIPYFNYELARDIVDYRLLHEKISSFEELAVIPKFPYQKIDRIKLYLSLE